MHHGVFCGDDADKRTDRILILGESHHVSTDQEVIENNKPGIPATYTTAEVIREYLESPYKPTLRFYDKIVQSFGYTPELSRENFWKSVYFGNYIDVLCGIQDGYAARMIDCNDNRKTYNDQLFNFINKYGISTVFCYGVTTVYDNLPSLTEGERMEKKTIGSHNGKNVYLRYCEYSAGKSHDNTSIILENDLKVFGIGHPSAKGGFPTEIYAKVLSGKI